MISFSGRMNRDLPFRSHSEFHKSFSAEEGWKESSHAAFTNPLILSLAPHLHCLPTSLGPPTFCFLVWSYCQWKKATMKTSKTILQKCIEVDLKWGAPQHDQTCTHRKFCRKCKNFGQRLSTKFVSPLRVSRIYQTRASPHNYS